MQCNVSYYMMAWRGMASMYVCVLCIYIYDICCIDTVHIYICIYIHIYIYTYIYIYVCMYVCIHVIYSDMTIGPDI